MILRSPAHVIFFGMALSALQGAELSTGNRVRVSTNLSDFNISVFPGKAGYEADDESPVVSGTFGDGTVEDYRFFTSPSDSLSSYADGGAGLIAMATSPSENIGGVGESWSDLWTTTNPGVDFNTTPDFNTSFYTFARTANITGTIDISELESGTIYIPHGTFINQWNLTLSMTGPGQPTLTTSDAQTSNGPSVNYAWITDFSFNDAALYDTITYSYTNQDIDGSRARFMGIILDGISVATEPPEVANSPATAIRATAATIGGEIIDATASLPEMTLYWGDDDGGTNPANWDHAISFSEKENPFSSLIEGLIPNTTYYYRAFASNNAGDDWADSSASFTTAPPPDLPSLASYPATNITGFSAVLNGGIIDTGGDTTTVVVFYGTNDGGTTPESWESFVNLGPQDSDFSLALSGLSPLTTYYFRVQAENFSGQTWSTTSGSFTTDDISELIITEFLADNDGTYSNYPNPNQIPGRLDDWIEIYNTTPGTIQLGGWHLTDDIETPAKWTFPAGTSLGPGNYLLVYASGLDEVDANGNLHSNFSLNADGEYLALLRPDLTIASAFDPDGSNYPAQQSDVSYGIHPTSALPVFFQTPTPGEANDPGGRPRVKDTRFSLDRGIYNSPIEVVITTATPETTIYYTIDGAAPIDASGSPTPTALIYSDPIDISATTILRAAAIKEGYEATNIDTQSYLFPSSVLTQPNNPPGLPTSWGATSADFEVDPEVTNSTLPGYSMEEALLAIPSLSISTAPGDLFSSSGIYYNSGSKGSAWERQASLEFLDPDLGDQFQIDCGVAVHGASSRSHGFTKKHSLRLLFKNEFGEAKLRFPLFEDGPTDEFDLLILRACSTDSWPAQEGGNHYGVQRWRSQDGSYQRDQWMRDTQVDLGHDSARGRYVHLYLNGLYWGLYNIVERPNNSFHSSHFGGTDEDWDVIHDRGELQAGDFTAWNAMFALADAGLVSDADYLRLLGKNPDGSDNPAYPVYLDLDHFIDYMIFHIYAGAEDWPCHNYWTARRRGPDSEGFRFYVWDQEISNNSLVRERTWCDIHFELLESDAPFLSSRSDLRKSPAKLYYQLRQNASFRQKFSDRVHELLFNDGLLSPDQSHARWMRRATEIDQAIVGESARWGDSRLSTPHKRETQWIPHQNWLRDTYWPANHDLAVQRFRNVGLYPSIEAPAFTPPGGSVNPGTEVTFDPLPGSPPIYYTTDGSDPRLPDGSIAPTATLFSTPLTVFESQLIQARTYEGGEWSALTSSAFTVDLPIRITELMYHPAGGDDAEFIELMNISGAPVEIAGIYFDNSTSGIAFTFDPAEPALGPGERIVAARNQSVFAATYNTTGIRIALGDYSASGTKLSNDGEQLTLRDSFGGPIQQFTYNDVAPWPEPADGGGPSLVLISPDSDPDPNDPANWRLSSRPGGNPGTSDALAFSGDPNADQNGNGVPDLVDHALLNGEQPIISVANNQLSFEFNRDLRADDVTITIQLSSDLETWTDIDPLLLQRSYLGNSGMRINLGIPIPSQRHFYRILVQSSD